MPQHGRSARAAQRAIPFEPALLTVSTRRHSATLRGVLTRLQLERGQILFYLVAIAIGAVLGWNAPTLAPLLEKLL